MKLGTAFLTMAMIASAVVAASGTASAETAAGNYVDAGKCAYEATNGYKYVCQATNEDGCFLIVWLWQNPDGDKVQPHRVYCDATAQWMS